MNGSVYQQNTESTQPWVPKLHRPKTPVSSVPSEPVPPQLGMPVSRRNEFPGLLLSESSDPNPLSLVTIIKRCRKRECMDGCHYKEQSH